MTCETPSQLAVVSREPLPWRGEPSARVMSGPETYLRYKRSRFSTRLHRERRYSASHQWLWER